MTAPTPKNSDAHGDPIIAAVGGRLSPNELLTRLKEWIGADGVPDNRPQRRAKMLAKVYNEYFAERDKVYLNPLLLRQAVESYYCDVYRLKFFRNVEWIDDHKKAAYTIKWIAKIRPIQVKPDAGKLTTSILLANDYFATISGISLLGFSLKGNSAIWLKNYVGYLTYQLHFHSVSGEQLSAEMYLLSQLAEPAIDNSQTK